MFGMYRNLPRVSVQEVAEKCRTESQFIILDIREEYETSRVSLADARVQVSPLSEIARKGVDALPEDARDRNREIYVLCHHGSRSVQVTAWMQKEGFSSVYNVDGGIDAWAKKVDPSIGFY